LDVPALAQKDLEKALKPNEGEKELLSLSLVLQCTL